MLELNITPDTNFLQTRSTYRLSVSISENDFHLNERFVSATIDWGDGSEVTEIEKAQIPDGQTATTAVIYEHVYEKKGSYTVTVTARNYRTPNPDKATAFYYITITDATVEVESVTARTLVGPILPRDTGSPNREQWSLDTGKGLAVIESSIKLLLSTQVGEWVYNPSIGTDISRHIFDQNDSDLDARLRETITTAINRYAQFVKLATINVKQDQLNNSVTLDLTFLHTSARQSFNVNLNYVL